MKHVKNFNESQQNYNFKRIKVSKNEYKGMNNLNVSLLYLIKEL